MIHLFIAALNVVSDDDDNNSNDQRDILRS